MNCEMSIWCWIIPLIVGIICAILGYLLGRLFSKDKYKNRISDLENELASCINKKSGISSEINNYKTKISSLEKDLEDCKAKYSNEQKSYKTKMSDLELSLAAITKRESDYANEINNYKTKISSLEKDLENCKAKYSNEQKSYKTKMSDLELSLAAITKRESDYANEVNKYKTKIYNLEKDLAICQANKKSFDADAAKLVFGKRIKEDDLKLVEGIGPKIEGLFHKFGIKTWKALSETSIEKCQEVLDSGGDSYRIHNPGTWPRQAALAYEGKFKELLIWQDELDGGK